MHRSRLTDGSGRATARYLVGKVRLRIEQSIKGLSLVEKRANDDPTRSLARKRVANRIRLLEDFNQAVLAKWNLPERRFMDIGGTIHRFLMKLLAQGEDGGLLLEVDRGEKWARRAVLKALDHQHRTGAVGEEPTPILKELLVEIEDTRNHALTLERGYPLKVGSPPGP